MGTLTITTSGFGTIVAFGIEGTGSYGATLTSFLRRHGHKVVEASRPDRRSRRANGKADTLDAENAARSVLAGFATVIPQTADGVVEMIRQLKIAHDSAVADRSAAMVTIKAMLVHGSGELRRETNRKTQIMLARHLAALRPRALETPRRCTASRLALPGPPLAAARCRGQGHVGTDRATRH